MKRNIVICSDGTGNTFDKSVSSVTRLIKLIVIDAEQRVVYDQGIGTNADRLAAVRAYRESIGSTECSGSPLSILPGPRQLQFHWASLFLRFAGLVGGYGLKANVCEMYGKLAELFEGPDDHIFLFGFSRGAFTVRALAGLIYHCGLPRADVATDPKKLKACFQEGWKLYKKMPTRRTAIRKNQEKVRVFREKHCRTADCEIHFLGVWDTVKSYGGIVPIKLPHLRHNPLVRTVRHAVALNERRSWFNVTTWGQLDSDENGAKRRLDPAAQVQHRYACQKIEEVWFRGCHSDIGGGDEEEETASVALRWMLGESQTAELRLNERGECELRGDGPKLPVKIHDLYSKWWWADFIPRCEIDNSPLYPTRRFAWGRTGQRSPQSLTRKGVISLHSSAATLIASTTGHGSR